MSESLAPPEPNKLQRDIVASPASWFVQTPLCIGAGLVTARFWLHRGGGNLWRSKQGQMWLGGAAFAFAVMMPFDVWFYRRAVAAVADRDGWEMRQKRLGRPVLAPVGVRGADGQWRAEEPMTAETEGTGLDAAPRGDGGGSETGWVGDGARNRGGGEEELQDPWALPQSKKGGSSRWS